MSFIGKAVARGLTLPNIFAWASQKWLFGFDSVWGTFRLRLKARLLGIGVGKNVRCHGKVGLLRWPGGKIAIGDNVSIISSWRRATAASLAFPARLRVFGPGAQIRIDEGAQLSGTAITARSTCIHIGKNVLIGPNCIIVDSDFHAPWPAQNRAFSPGYENDAPVTINDYAWIGLNSIILKGVTIGEGAIIGAGSVVSRDVPAWCVACGSPCRVVHNYAHETSATGQINV